MTPQIIEEIIQPSTLDVSITTATGTQVSLHQKAGVIFTPEEASRILGRCRDLFLEETHRIGDD